MTAITMSFSVFSRRVISAARPVTVNAVRFKSSKAISTEKLNKINASTLLTSISSSTNNDFANSDEDAKAWIQAVKDLRNEFTHDGTAPFSPTKAFSADGETEVNLLLQAYQAKAQDNKFVPTEEQQVKYESLKEVPLPQKKDETIDFLTNVIMRHGRKSRAQRTMNEALYLVYLQTRVDPAQLLKDTLEKMAPVLKLKRYTDGGARAEMVPTPLTRRQRLRAAWNWIIEASDKRPSKSFSVRLAEEIITASKGSGSGYDKKTQLHAAGIAARSFIQKL